MSRSRQRSKDAILKPASLMQTYARGPRPLKMNTSIHSLFSGLQVEVPPILVIVCKLIFGSLAMRSLPGEHAKPDAIGTHVWHPSRTLDGFGYEVVSLGEETFLRRERR